MQDPKIYIKPHKAGISNNERVIIATQMGDHLIDVSKDEVALLSELENSKPHLSDFLADNMNSKFGLSFGRAIDLIRKLHRNGYIETDSQDLWARLDELTLARPKPKNQRIERCTHKLQEWLNINLLLVLVKPAQRMRPLGRAALHPAFLGLSLLVSLVLGFQAFGTLSESPMAMFEIFNQPNQILVNAILALAFCTSSLSIIRAMVVSSIAKRPIQCKLNLTGFFIPTLVVDDSPAFLSTREKAVHYFAFSLILPMLLSTIFLNLADFKSLDGFAILGAGYLASSILYFFPFSRTPYVKIAEAWLVKLNILSAAQAYLGSRLLSDIKPIKRHSHLKRRTEKSVSLDRWMALHASFALVYLYGFNLYGTELLLKAIPELLLHVKAELTVETFSASIIISALSGLSALAFLKFVSIIIKNIYSLSRTPLIKARNSLGEFYAQVAKPSDALYNFLRAIPIFSQVSEEATKALIGKLRYKDCEPGFRIINQGEAGTFFCILATGEAKVFIRDREGNESLVDTLRPGDTFGEIALVQDLPRQASIEAGKDCRIFFLSRKSFDAVFQKGTEERESLTKFIINSKLLMETQILSYLRPNEIHQLIHDSSVVNFQENEIIIEQGTTGDCAYVLISGKAKVILGPNRDNVADLERGDLFGTIALVKDIPRTASVIAASEQVRCIKIPKSRFINLCINNLTVGSLIAELSDSQLEDLRTQWEAS